MTDPVQTYNYVRAKFPGESTLRKAEYVEIYPSGLMLIEWRDAVGTWYPPTEAPIVEET